MKNTLAILILCLAPALSWGQNDSLHSPKKAVWMSALLPGLGQAYNKKYWKMPLVYAAIGGAAYGVHYNSQQYQTYRDAYILRVDGNPNTVDRFDPSTGNAEVYSQSQLNTLQDYYRSQRDLMVILTAAAYLINILDAYVDAHLFYFDVSDDLSARWNFSTWSHPQRGNTGLGLTIALEF